MYRADLKFNWKNQNWSIVSDSKEEYFFQNSEKGWKISFETKLLKDSSYGMNMLVLKKDGVEIGISRDNKIDFSKINVENGVIQNNIIFIRNKRNVSVVFDYEKDFEFFQKQIILQEQGKELFKEKGKALKEGDIFISDEYDQLNSLTYVGEFYVSNLYCLEKKKNGNDYIWRKEKVYMSNKGYIHLGSQYSFEKKKVTILGNKKIEDYKIKEKNEAIISSEKKYECIYCKTKEECESIELRVKGE